MAWRPGAFQQEKGSKDGEKRADGGKREGLQTSTPLNRGAPIFFLPPSLCIRRFFFKGRGDRESAMVVVMLVTRNFKQ